MSRKPEGSFPQVLSPAELEAAYRFFNNVQVQPADVLEPHVRQTLRRASDQPMVLVVHDSSTMSFNSEGYRDGLGSTGQKQQFLAHCSLALKADGSRTPLGMLVASHHVPTKSVNKGLQNRWADHVRDVHRLGLSPRNVVHLMDREADDYEVLDLLCRLDGRFVIRVQHNRRLAADERVRDVVERSEVRVRRTVPLSRRGTSAGSKQQKIHPPRESRDAYLAIACSRVVISRPASASATCHETLALNVVRVWEPDPPKGETPVEWLLYTSEPVHSNEDILRVVDWYRARWTIEEYFKALKTGCALEKRQLGDLHALTNVLALFMPIAWQLLLLRSEARQRPDGPASDVLSNDEITVLRLAGRVALSAQPTVRDVMLAVAALGGHLKHNGQPGWQTLARGYDYLRALVEGWSLQRHTNAGIMPPSRDQ